MPAHASHLEGELPDGGTIRFDPDLPIAAHADEIADLIDHHQVVVVAGETGSGKTTQLPKICLALGRRHIAHTQPRRIAARSVADRIADEMGVEIGDQVGFQVRFTKRATRATALTVMTDGVLLAEISHDRELRAHDTIIIDEAHERSLNIDFLLGYLKQLLPRRPDLKVIITSATIDTARFSAHFDDAPVIEVSGRTYPVEIRYRPLDPAEDLAEDEDDITVAADPIDQTTGICRAVQELSREGTGDILVFLAGERDIRDAAEALTDLRLRDTEILPLFARLSAAEQHRVFTRHPGRRIVLATNVAETSLTVPGIRYVIDPGTARISRYSVRTHVQRLPIEPVSQASANQRSGRCGRVAPGICIRLYSQRDFDSRPEFTQPEILRTNLAAVILQMAQARLGAITDFPFVEAPDHSQVADGLRLLDELGALKSGHREEPRLTRIGHQLATIPVDPRLGRMILEGARQHSLREVLVIVAALSIPDARERPADKRDKADVFHHRFLTETGLQRAMHPETADQNEVGGPVDQGGDILAIHRLWRYLHHQRKALSGSAFRRMCHREFLNFLRVREWEDLHSQLKQICRELKLERNKEAAPEDRILVALLSGLLSHIGLAEVADKQKNRTTGDKRRRGHRSGPREYLGARGARFAINPGSALAKHPPELVMAVELVETSRLWARTVAGVQPEWVEEVGGHLLKRQYSEPHWAQSTASVVATERATLYGVPVWADRLVNYARIDPVVAREIFIRSALVERDWRANHGFLVHNDRVRNQAEDLEERSRQRGLVADDDALFAFYDRRIPSDIVSANHFNAWWRRVEDRHQLDLSLDDLVDPQAVARDDFPDHWEVGELSLPVRYVFDPGSGHDGVTVTIPLALLNQVPSEPFSWQVPGLRTELATELIRSLPKKVRTQLVPAPDRARQALAWLESPDPGAGHPDVPRGDHDAPFTAELGRALTALTGVLIDDSDWRPDQIPAHLRVGFDVVDAEGRRTGQAGSPQRGSSKHKPPKHEAGQHGTSKQSRSRVAHSEDLSALRVDLAPKVSVSLTRAAGDDQVHGATDWAFGTLAREVSLRRSGADAVGYPCLVDEGSTVGTAVRDSVAAQTRSHGAGVVRLLLLNLPDPTTWTVAHLSNRTKLALAGSPYPSVPALLADSRRKAVDSLARRHAGDLSDIRDRQAFEKLALAVRQEAAETMARVVSTAAEILTAWGEARSAVTALAPGPARQDMTNQLSDLVFLNFISATPDPWYQRMSRWMREVAVRAEGVSTNPGRDARWMAELDPLLDAYDSLCAAQPPGPLPAGVEEIGFLIEELRIQLFAQRLQTTVPVSVKKVRTAISRLVS
ncbi:MAG: ATP-dependent RNA helicase HrpA [Acidipropionibacterium jensenii]|uniref:ATP-dependent RNA helicase HrpA n=1 Tax=Acidipropionibacterium jensenii TaxID=1749 RepID=UPI0026481A65|nr:ATP-dependent RNA helicase HrpA [Acidipropionibacterium jensenii]MDN6512107.1 ATP-dependent RNA helicase HrpA [Acidipropionibacterium jensenii]